MKNSSLLSLCLLLVSGLFSVEGFVANSPAVPKATTTVSSLVDSTTRLEATTPLTSSVEVSAATLDPTTFLSDALGGLLGTPAILAIPIVAALGVASLVAFLIVSYASPAADDDE